MNRIKRLVKEACDECMEKSLSRIVRCLVRLNDIQGSNKRVGDLTHSEELGRMVSQQRMLMQKQPAHESIILVTLTSEVLKAGEKGCGLSVGG